jgi:hypothetical protein
MTVATSHRADVAELLRLPYVEGGRMVDGQLPSGGLDCWGFVVEFRRRQGLWTPDPWADGLFGCDADPDGLPGDLTVALVRLEAPQPFCCVQLRSDWVGGHAGIWLPNSTLAHLGRKGAWEERWHKVVGRHGRVLGIFDFDQELAP